MPPKGDSGRDELPDVELELVRRLSKEKEVKNNIKGVQGLKGKCKSTAIHSNHARFEIFK